MELHTQVLCVCKMCIFIVILQVVLLDEKEMKLRYLTQENEDLKQQIKLYQVCTYV